MRYGGAVMRVGYVAAVPGGGVVPWLQRFRGLLAAGAFKFTQRPLAAGRHLLGRGQLAAKRARHARWRGCYARWLCYRGARAVLCAVACSAFAARKVFEYLN